MWYRTYWRTSGSGVISHPINYVLYFTSQTNASTMPS
jgi:hypothetical protein